MKFKAHIIYSNFKKIFFALLLAVYSCASLADYTLNMHPGVSEISRRTYHLHMTIFIICVIIGLIVYGVLIYSLIMHRKSRGHKAHDFHENTTVEIIWTVIPFLILISMAFPATSVLKFIDDKSNSDVLIKVTGYQWRWHYEYPDHDINFYSNLLTPQEQISNKDPKDPLYLYSVDNPLVLPINKKIRFIFTANDVIHSWWVPKLGIKKDSVPGFINESWVKIDEPGTYHGQCAELCGARHAYMPIVVEAKTEDDYQKWLDSKKVKPEATPAPSDTKGDNTSQAKEQDNKTSETTTKSSDKTKTDSKATQPAAPTPTKKDQTKPQATQPNANTNTQDNAVPSKSAGPAAPKDDKAKLQATQPSANTKTQDTPVPSKSEAPTAATPSKDTDDKAKTDAIAPKPSESPESTVPQNGNNNTKPDTGTSSSAPKTVDDKSATDVKKQNN